MAESGLGRVCRWATPALVVGANLPDIDGVAQMFGTDASLGFRRGWTHGVLAMALLPLFCAGLMLGIDWLRRRKRGGQAVPAIPLLLLLYLATFTHPLLDWLNTYGVRLLMPLSERWFYGDALFIIDPWFWLAVGASVVLARSSRRRSLGAWALLALVTTAIVTVPALVPWPAKLVWIALLLVIVGLRAHPRHRAWVTWLARSGLAVLLLYIAASLAITSHLRQAAFALAETEDLGRVNELFVGPVPADPLAREAVIDTTSGVHFATLRLWPAEATLHDESLPVRQKPDLLDAAMTHPDVEGIAHWLRLPYHWVTPLPGGETLIEVIDLRYARGKKGERPALGAVRVWLDATGTPLRAEPGLAER